MVLDIFKSGGPSSADDIYIYWEFYQTGKNGGAQMLIGSDANNVLSTIWDDVIDGGAGNDRLYGNEGDDILKTGAGDDVFMVEAEMIS